MTLIDSIRRSLGEAALETVIAERETESRARYREGLAGAKTLKARSKRSGELAHRRRLHGGSRTRCRIRHGCSRRITVRSARQREVVRDSAGTNWSCFASCWVRKSRVERVEYVLGGGRRCAYRITPTVAELDACGRARAIRAPRGNSPGACPSSRHSDAASATRSTLRLDAIRIRFETDLQVAAAFDHVTRKARDSRSSRRPESKRATAASTLRAFPDTHRARSSSAAIRSRLSRHRNRTSRTRPAATSRHADIRR